MASGSAPSGPLSDPNLITGQTSNPSSNAVFGRNDATNNSTEPGVHGTGVFGLTTSPGAAGVFGSNNSTKGVGVQGNGPEAGVSGFSQSGSGLRGNSTQGSAIVVSSETGHGLDAFSNKDIAIFAQGGTFAGVFNGALVVNKTPNLNPDPSNAATPIDGSIVINEGNLFVNKGDVILANADCAEDFDVSGTTEIEPGTVMVLENDGRLHESCAPYDKRVAGVVSGAGNYKPGLVLDRHTTEETRVPVALMGKVYCKVDARYGPVEIGDLLTTSPTSGFAMKAADPRRAFGAVIGKALRPLDAGQGLVPILVALQ